ncbi:MAG: Spo0B domain-containing protein, partial [Clostridia bacterium]|nr:Spo0B domain-containing protein [Clostridia bacterium]
RSAKVRTEKKKPSHFQRYIFRTQLLIVLSLAAVLGAVSIAVNLREEARQRDLNLTNVAEAVAHSPTVREAAAGGGAVPEESLDTLKGSLADIDVISVVRADGRRLYHSNHELIGTVFDGTRPDFAGRGSSYTVTDRGPSGIQRRAYAAVRGTDGEITGFVMAIMLVENIRAQEWQTVLLLLGAVALAVLGEFFLSYRIAGRIRERLLGYEPDAFSAMYRIRENTLESLDEGVVAVDKEGRVQFMNEAARALLDEGKENVPQETVDKLFGGLPLSGEKESSVPVRIIEGADVLIDRIPLQEDGEIRGAVGILHDRTAFTRMAEDLAGTRYLVDSMRANNHDFTNKLHVILGLLQMERYDEAARYIEKITLVRRETVSAITRQLEVPAVVALLIGKTARAAEVNVRLVLQKDSSLHPGDVAVPPDTLVTVIGNLVDNALDAMDGWKGPDEEGNELFIGIRGEKGRLLITVDDTGPGMEEAVLARIFDKGYSTKGEGRGTGLFEVKRLVESIGGAIWAESQPGAGTSFTVSFSEEKKGE